MYLRCNVQVPLFNAAKVFRPTFKALAASSSWFPCEFPGHSACPTDHEKLAFSWGSQHERRQPTPSPDQGMQSQELFYTRCAPLAVGRGAPGGLEQGKGATGPGDRHEGHRGTARPACAGQLRLATCSAHQEIRKPNCSIHHYVW